ncbi:MAG: SUMF1/EgtB/PvdO family nonheme iron enzyme [Kiritimatiellia bacterium]|jgi:formylglycine-generating enzyme required for sulfatase activity
MNELSWWKYNSGNTTHPVGEKVPNAWGLYDMHGNVREWALNWYGAALVGGAVDPEGAELGTRRVVRGGGYDVDSDGCSSTIRYNDPPIYTAHNLGLRLVMTLP